MARHLLAWFAPFRRNVLLGGVGAVLSRPPTLTAASNPFERWEAERRELEADLDRLPEATFPFARDRVLTRMSELERLILETPSFELSAVRVKAGLLTWLMEMEQADGLSAMRHIQDYLDRGT